MWLYLAWGKMRKGDGTSWAATLSTENQIINATIEGQNGTPMNHTFNWVNTESLSTDDDENNENEKKRNYLNTKGNTGQIDGEKKENTGSFNWIWKCNSLITFPSPVEWPSKWKINPVLKNVKEKKIMSYHVLSYHDWKHDWFVVSFVHWETNSKED